MFYFFKRGNQKSSADSNNQSDQIKQNELRKDGIYVFQYKGLNKLGNKHSEITQILFFLDESQVFIDEIDEVVEIDTTKIKQMLSDIRSIKEHNRNQIGFYSKENNWIKIEAKAGHQTYYFEGALTDNSLLLNVNVEYTNYEKGCLDRLKVFENIKYKFMPS